MTKAKHPLRIMIPTRDSARWIVPMLQRYRALGEEPLFIYDTRSVDDTRRLLEELGAEVYDCTPSADFAEAGMIEFGSKVSGASWILRLDDDEFPTRRLLDWSRHEMAAPQFSAYRISRRDVTLREGRRCFSRWPARWAYAHHFLPNAHTRLHAVSRVKYIEELHTSGVEPVGAVGGVPQDCFFIHCNNLLRSPAERLEKLRLYARYDHNIAWENADESLPELTEDALHDWSEEGLDEFDEFLNTLPTADRSPPNPTDQERAWIASALLRRLQEERDKREAFLGLKTGWFRLVPKPLIRPLAQFLLSARVRRLHDVGIQMWNYHCFLESQSSGRAEDQPHSLTKSVTAE